MTKLEQQMLKAVEKAHYDYGEAVGGSEDFFIAEAVAKIALELAEDAYEEGRSGYILNECYGYDHFNFKQFIEDYEQNS